jgi:hypothetical protein
VTDQPARSTAAKKIRIPARTPCRNGLLRLGSFTAVDHSPKKEKGERRAADDPRMTEET